MKLNLDKKAFWIPLIFLLLSTSTFAAITGETNPCRGVFYTYTYAGGNTCFSKNFSVTGGVFEDGSTSKVVSADINGNFNVKVKWGTAVSGRISANSCTNTPMELLVQIKGPSGVTITPASQTISNGQSVTLVASSDWPIYNYSCNTPRTCGSLYTTGNNSSTITVSPSASAIYTVTVSTDGCNRSATSTITVGSSNDPYANSSVRLQGRYETVCGTLYSLFITGVNGNVLPYCCTVFEKRTTNGSWQTLSTNTDGPITENTFYRATHNGVISNTISREVTPISYYVYDFFEPTNKDVFEGQLILSRRYFMDDSYHVTINAMEIRIQPGCRLIGSQKTLTLRGAPCGMDLGYKNKDNYREGELDLYTTVDNINKDNIISPNPATNTIKVSLSDSEKATISIFDNKGILMLEKSIDQKDDHIDVSILAPGFYILKSNQNGNITNQKFVKSE